MIIKSIVLLRWVSNSTVMNVVSKIGFKDVEKRQMKINKIYFVSTGAKLLTLLIEKIITLKNARAWGSMVFT